MLFEFLKEQFRILNKKLDWLIGLKRTVRFDFEVGPVVNKQPKETDTMLEINLTNEQKVTVTLHPVTGTGRPAAVDGVPEWSVVSGNGTVTPAADGMSADLISSDDPGDTIYMVSADVDLGSGITIISDTITLHVSHANAENLGMTAGDPQPK